MSSVQDQRIEANCKIIWGNFCVYDLDTETDDNVHYVCFVRKDHGDSFGPPLIVTGLCHSSKAAWAELDRMLQLLARQVQRGTPMTRDERLEFAGGPKGEHRHILSIFLDEMEKRESVKHA
jgi:hypothetical protein